MMAAMTTTATQRPLRVFVTGASGFVGSAVVQELIAAGHRVLGLARSDESAARVSEAGAAVHRGSLEDLESLQVAASACDGVIHTAFIHDFTNLPASAQRDYAVIEALGETLAGVPTSPSWSPQPARCCPVAAS